MLRSTLLLTTALLLTGCGETESTPPAEASPETSEVSLSPEMEAKLKLADQLDGSEDHVIGKCYVCSLGMDGKSELTVEVDGYTANLCSDACRKHFADNWQTVVANTDVPAADQP